MQTAAIVILA